MGADLLSVETIRQYHGQRLRQRSLQEEAEVVSRLFPAALRRVGTRWASMGPRIAGG